MLTEYIEEALRRAKYEIIEDEEPFYSEVEELPGVWATGKTLLHPDLAVTKMKIPGIRTAGYLRYVRKFYFHHIRSLYT